MVQAAARRLRPVPGTGLLVAEIRLQPTREIPGKRRRPRPLETIVGAIGVPSILVGRPPRLACLPGKAPAGADTRTLSGAPVPTVATSRRLVTRAGVANRPADSDVNLSYIFVMRAARHALHGVGRPQQDKHSLNKAAKVRKVVRLDRLYRRVLVRLPFQLLVPLAVRLVFRRPPLPCLLVVDQVKVSRLLLDHVPLRVVVWVVPRLLSLVQLEGLLHRHLEEQYLRVVELPPFEEKRERVQLRLLQHLVVPPVTPSRLLLVVLVYQVRRLVR